MLVTINNKEYEVTANLSYFGKNFSISCHVSECKYFIDWIINNQNKFLKKDIIGINSENEPLDFLFYGCYPKSMETYSDNEFHTIEFNVDRYDLFYNEIRDRENKFKKLLDVSNDK